MLIIDAARELITLIEQLKKFNTQQAILQPIVAWLEQLHAELEHLNSNIAELKTNILELISEKIINESEYLIHKTSLENLIYEDENEINAPNSLTNIAYKTALFLAKIRPLNHQSLLLEDFEVIKARGEEIIPTLAYCYTLDDLKGMYQSKHDGKLVHPYNNAPFHPLDIIRVKKLIKEQGIDITDEEQFNIPDNVEDDAELAQQLHHSFNQGLTIPSSPSTATMEMSYNRENSSVRFYSSSHLIKEIKVIRRGLNHYNIHICSFPHSLLLAKALISHGIHEKTMFVTHFPNHASPYFNAMLPKHARSSAEKIISTVEAIANVSLADFKSQILNLFVNSHEPLENNSRQQWILVRDNWHNGSPLKLLSYKNNFPAHITYIHLQKKSIDKFVILIQTKYLEHNRHFIRALQETNIFDALHNYLVMAPTSPIENTFAIEAPLNIVVQYIEKILSAISLLEIQIDENIKSHIVETLQLELKNENHATDQIINNNEQDINQELIELLKLNKARPKNIKKDHVIWHASFSETWENPLDHTSDPFIYREVIYYNESPQVLIVDAIHLMEYAFGKYGLRFILENKSLESRIALKDALNFFEIDPENNKNIIDFPDIEDETEKQNKSIEERKSYSRLQYVLGTNFNSFKRSQNLASYEQGFGFWMIGTAGELNASLDAVLKALEILEGPIQPFYKGLISKHFNVLYKPASEFYLETSTDSKTDITNTTKTPKNDNNHTTTPFWNEAKHSTVTPGNKTDTLDSNINTNYSAIVSVNNNNTDTSFWSQSKPSHSEWEKILHNDAYGEKVIFYRNKNPICIKKLSLFHTSFKEDSNPHDYIDTISIHLTINDENIINIALEKFGLINIKGFRVQVKDNSVTLEFQANPSSRNNRSYFDKVLLLMEEFEGKIDDNQKNEMRSILDAPSIEENVSFDF